MLHQHWPASFSFPHVDENVFFEEEGYPWAYPTDAGFESSWPALDVVENPLGDLFWPTLYDPRVTRHVHYPAHVAGATAPQTPAEWLRSGGVSYPSMPWLQKAYGTVQDVGQKFAQAVQSATPSLVPGALTQSGIPDAASKASDAADAMRRQANVLGDEGRRTMAIAQASLADANRQIEDTAKQAQAAAEAVKYVVIGVGALTTIALLFHIVKQASE